MRTFDEAFENDLTGYVITGAPAIDPASPLHGGALKFTCGSINCIEKVLPYPQNIFFKGLHLLYEDTEAANGILEWRDGTNAVGDLRFNTSGQIELRIGGVLQGTTVRTFSPSVKYNLQFALTYTTQAGKFELRINDSPVPDLVFFGQTDLGGTPGSIYSFRYGSIVASGNGDGWIDDIALNDGYSFSLEMSVDATWPGVIFWLAQNPVGVTAFDEWVADPVTSKWLNLDESPNDGDTSIIKSEVNGQRQGIAFGAFNPPTGAVLQAVKYEATIRATVAGQIGIARLGFSNSADTPADEVVVITLSGMTLPWYLALEGNPSSYLPPSPTAVEVQNALRGIAEIFPDGVAVSGSTGGPFTVTFQNHLSGTAFLLTLDAQTENQPGGTVTIVRTTAGAGIKYGSIPIPNGYYPFDMTDSFQEALPGTSYVKRSARRRKAPSGAAWSLASANASELVIRSQNINP